MAGFKNVPVLPGKGFLLFFFHVLETKKKWINTPKYVKMCLAIGLEKNYLKFLMTM